MRDTTPEHVAPHNTYGAFIRDLKERDVKILPEPELRGKIAQARDAGLPEENRLNARNEVFDSVLRVLPFVIRGLPTSGIPPEELIGEAAEVVDACINNFDLEHVSPKIEDHPRFSSYVIKSLRLKLASPRSVVRVGELASVPVHVEGLASSMRKARELFMQEEQREPTQEEWYKRTVKLIGETKGFSALQDAKFQAFEGAQLAKFNKPASIGKSYARGYIDPDALSVRAGNIGDDVADESVDTAEEAISNVLKDDVEKALGSLTDTERTIIEMRYGLGLNEEGKPRHEMTLEEVARVFGVTRERIRQKESKALRKMRHPVVSTKLRDYLDDEPPQDVKPNPNYTAWKLKEGFDTLDSLWQKFEQSYPKDKEFVSAEEKLLMLRTFFHEKLESYKLDKRFTWTNEKEAVLGLLRGDLVYFQLGDDRRMYDWFKSHKRGKYAGEDPKLYITYSGITQKEQLYVDALGRQLQRNGRESIANLNLSPNILLTLVKLHDEFPDEKDLDFTTIQSLEKAVEEKKLDSRISGEAVRAIRQFYEK